VNTAELLTEVQRRGIQLRAEGATLHYRAPKGVLTPDLKAALKAHKSGLLKALRERRRYRVYEYRRQGARAWSTLTSIRSGDTTAAVKTYLEEFFGCSVEVRLHG